MTMLLRFIELILQCISVVFIFIAIIMLPAIIGVGIPLLVIVYLVIEGINYVLGEHK